MANRESSDAMSSKAASVMARRDPFHDDFLAILFDAAKAENGDLQFREAVHALFDPWVKSARSLAGSVLSQDETAGKRADAEPTASSTAYEMLAAAEKANVEITETLVNMVIATVLAKLIDEQGGGRANLTFSAIDMDHMLERYEMDATRSGMEVTVKITPKPGAFAANGDELVIAEPVMFDTEDAPPADDIVPHSSRPMIQPDEDTTDAEEQAEVHQHDRPLWAARVEGKLWPASDRRMAERVVENAASDVVAQVENRFCYHPQCPAERCNIGTSEVTSND